LSETLAPGYEVLSSGYPQGPDGFVADRHLFRVRVELSDRPDGPREHRSFYLTLTQRSDGGWCVALPATCRSLAATNGEEQPEIDKHFSAQESARPTSP